MNKGSQPEPSPADWQLELVDSLIREVGKGNVQRAIDTQDTAVRATAVGVSGDASIVEPALMGGLEPEDASQAEDGENSAIMALSTKVGQAGAVEEVGRIETESTGGTGRVEAFRVRSDRKAQAQLADCAESEVTDG